MTSSFIPGIRLAEQFYREAVRPILDGRFPRLKHAAALLDGGSEVLGFDDAMSTDHNWGPRVQLFLSDEDRREFSDSIFEILSLNLPGEFQGYPTSFAAPGPEAHGVLLLEPVASGPVHHRVSVQTVRSFVIEHLGFDVEATLEPADWLTFSEQRLRTLMGGPIYHDDLGLRDVRSRFAYYPRDVWLYQLAAGWARIGQEEHLMGRAGLAGDEVGSVVIGARLVRDVMRVCFLMERTYAPYPKWFGSAFQRLAAGPVVGPALRGALRAENWQEREACLTRAYEYLAEQHNTLGLTEHMPERTTSFFGRPFQVMALHGFVQALLTQVEDPAVRRLAARPLIGGIDLLSDNTDLVSTPVWRPLLRRLFE